MLITFSRKLILTVFVFCLLSTANTLLAQESAIKYADEFTSENGGGSSFSIQLENKDDLTTTVFFTDKENQLLFIDFEALGEDISKISIINGDETVLDEDVSTLPINTIYEIDLKDYENGKQYKMLIHTSFGILTQTFKISK